jgi:ribonuclease HI
MNTKDKPGNISLAEKRLPKTYIAYFDGACEPVNPGGTASYGAAIYENQQLVWKCSQIYGRGEHTSNNVAEYAALIAVLEWFADHELLDAEIIVRGDSKLVIEQMFGSWKIKSGLYTELAHKARELLTKFAKIQGEWISRDRNEVADRLSKEALKRAGVKLRLQPV